MTATRGRAPYRLRGALPPSSPQSPWWDSVASELLSRPGMVGRTLTIEELTQIVPRYPEGGVPRGKTVARRLSRILELVSRGPNGSLGKGAVYRIKSDIRMVPVGREDIADEAISPDSDWLQQAVDRMTRNQGE